jgi:hypothetical protein
MMIIPMDTDLHNVLIEVRTSRTRSLHNYRHWCAEATTKKELAWARARVREEKRHLRRNARKLRINAARGMIYSFT